MADPKFEFDSELVASDDPKTHSVTGSCRVSIGLAGQTGIYSVNQQIPRLSITSVK